MKLDSGKILRLASAISDGANLDWDLVERGAGDERERNLLRDMRIIAELSGLARARQSAAGEVEDAQDDQSTGQSSAGTATVEIDFCAAEQLPQKWGHLEIRRRLASVKQ